MAWLDEWKLRLGYGQTGQQDINGYFPYMPIYTSSYKPGFQYIGPTDSGSTLSILSLTTAISNGRQPPHGT